MLPPFPDFMASWSATHQPRELLDDGLPDAWSAHASFEADPRGLLLHSQSSTGAAHLQPGGPSTAIQGATRTALDDIVLLPSPSCAFWPSTSNDYPPPPPTNHADPFSFDEDPKRDVLSDLIRRQIDDMSGTRNLHTYDIVGPNPYESQEARAMPHTTVPLAAEYAERPAEVAQVASVSRSEMAAQPTEDELSTGAVPPSEAISPLPSKQRKITIVGPKKGKNEGIRKPAPKKQHRSAKGKKNRPRPECLYRGCTDSCSRPRDRDRHMLIHFPPQYPCEACIRPLSIHRHDVFQRHMRDFHPELEDVSVELPYPWELNTKLIRKFKMPPSRDVDRVSCFIRQEKQKAAFDI